MTKTPSPKTPPRNKTMRKRSRSRSRSPPKRTSRSRTPESKYREIFTIFPFSHETEDDYLVDAKPGDILTYFGNDSSDTWRKVLKIQNGEKVWDFLPDQDNLQFGGKKKRKTKKHKRKTKKHN